MGRSLTVVRAVVESRNLDKPAVVVLVLSTNLVITGFAVVELSLSAAEIVVRTGAVGTNGDLSTSSCGEVLSGIDRL